MCDNLPLIHPKLRWQLCAQSKTLASDFLVPKSGRSLRPFRLRRMKMTYSQFDPATQSRVPWNFGAKIGPKRPFNQKQIWAIRFFLDREKRIRDRALFDLAIDSKLRGCDLVELKIGDLVSGPEIRTRATITQRKTGRPVQFEIASDARASLFAWLERRGSS